MHTSMINTKQNAYPTFTEEQALYIRSKGHPIAQVFPPSLFCFDSSALSFLHHIDSL